MLNAKKIGAKIRQLRGDKNSDTVATALRISKSALAMYERGERMPRDEVKIRIADYFEESVQNIFFTDDEH